MQEVFILFERLLITKGIARAIKKAGLSKDVEEYDLDDMEALFCELEEAGVIDFSVSIRSSPTEIDWLQVDWHCPELEHTIILDDKFDLDEVMSVRHLVDLIGFYNYKIGMLKKKIKRVKK